MQPAVFAPEVEQRVTARVEIGAQDFADENDVIAAVMDLVTPAFEVRERVGQQRRLMPATLSRRLLETFLARL